MLHDQAPLALYGFIILLFFAIIPASRQGLLVYIDGLENYDFLHSLKDG